MTNPAAIVANDSVKRAVGGIYEIMLGGRHEGPGALLADDVGFWVRGERENVPFAGSWNRPRSVVEFLASYRASVGRPAFRPRYSMLQEDGEETSLMLFVVEEGIAVPTGKTFSSESVHEWRLDRKGRIRRFAGWNNSFDLFQAFTTYAVEPSFVFRHPLDEFLVTPTRRSPVDAGAVAEQFYHCLLSEEWAALLDLMDPGIVSTLEGVEGVVPFSGTYRGVGEVRRQAAEFARTERNVYANLIPRYVVDGNRVCARFDEAGTYVFATGVAQNFTNLHCFTVNDAGRIATFRSYNDTWHVWLSWLPDEGRPACVSQDTWSRNRFKPGHPPPPPRPAGPPAPGGTDPIRQGG